MWWKRRVNKWVKTKEKKSHTRSKQCLKLYFSVFEIMPWEHNNLLLFAKFQPQKVDVNSWNFKNPFVCFKYYVDTCLFKILKYVFFFLLLKHPPNVQATLLWALIYFIKGVTYVDYFRCMYWILTGIILSD
jgi:hypothetical protein